MTVMIELPPELETRLQQEAAKLGMNSHEYARLLIERQLPATPSAAGSLWETLTPAEWVRAFDEWVNSHDYITAPPIPLEALRRENLYEDRV
jgi:hypothetical protein